MTHNVFTRREGNMLTVSIDLSEPVIAGAPVSSTGKTLLVANAAGEVVDPATGAKMNLSVTVANPNADVDIAKAEAAALAKAERAAKAAADRLARLRK